MLSHARSVVRLLSHRDRGGRCSWGGDRSRVHAEYTTVVWGSGAAGAAAGCSGVGAVVESAAKAGIRGLNDAGKNLHLR